MEGSVIKRLTYVGFGIGTEDLEAFCFLFCFVLFFEAELIKVN